MIKTKFQLCTHSDNYKLAGTCINKALHRLLTHTSYHGYSLCISYELLLFCIQGCVRQLQINAIQFPSLIPSIMIKNPTAFICLIRVAPHWDNACLYDSDKVAVPFVAAALIFEGWHSNAVLSTCSLLSVSVRLSEKVQRLCAAGEHRSSKHNEALPGASALGPFTEKKKIILFFTGAGRPSLALFHRLAKISQITTT